MTDSQSRLLGVLTQSPKWTVAVAESLTSGNVQARIGAIPGISAVFKGRMTAYAIDQKVRHLGVDAAHASEFDCVSERVAQEMARGVCALFSTTIGVATTGFASAPEWRAYWAICYNTNSALEIIGSGELKAPIRERVAFQKHVADQVLEAMLHNMEARRAAEGE